MEDAFSQQTPALTSLIKSTHLLRLEEMVRGAATIQELQFLAVNETRRLVPFRQAFWIRTHTEDRAGCQVVAASSVSIIERDAPQIQWIEQLIKAIPIPTGQKTPVLVMQEQVPERLQEQWKEFSFPHGLWCPLVHPDGSFVAGLWFTRDSPWEEADLTILQRLSVTFAHALKALGRQSLAQGTGTWSKVLLGTLLIACVASFFVPVRLSTLAPAKIIAKEPAVVSAPIDGVIADILVPPNTMVTQNQVIFRYEDTTLRNQYELAQKNLDVAIAEYRQASQRAFLDAQVKAEIPLLKAEAQLRETELVYAKEMLTQVEVKAPRSGLILYTDKADWIGRPITVGERVMEIANPKGIEVGIDLAVDDAIVLKEGAEVQVFLDAAPLAALTGHIRHASYHAEVLPEHTLAYRVKADLSSGKESVRIGWQGTAKIYGERVSLFFLLFRRPISFVRQTFGV